ncbi:MAG: YbjN domain-containing protein [Pseudomonadota bacterium]
MFVRPTATLSLAAIIPILLASALSAQTETSESSQPSDRLYFTSISPTEMLRILDAERGSIELDETGGDTTLEGRVTGKDYSVYFYECDGGEFGAPATPTSSCLGFEYRSYFTGYPDDSETINEWNANHHYGAMWRDEDGDLGLQLNTIVEGGITEDNIRMTFVWWQTVLESFDNFMEGR